MKSRTIVIYTVLFTIVSTVICLLILRNGQDKKLPQYTTEINRLLICYGENWDSISSKRGELISNSEPFEYSVIDADGELLILTKQGISVTVSAATGNYDIIRDITRGDDVVGRLIVHDPYQDEQRQSAQTTALLVGIMAFIMLVISVIYFIYLKKRIVEPFGKMKGFAERVAAGDLDTPLEMDRSNIFGAFTESFDIMREELRASREREAEAVKSRKEMIASLSHDIKTPVASIKAMTEVMELTASNEDEKHTIHAISQKADSIDKLVSNLFHATLEELNRLSVTNEELPSSELTAILNEADHLKKVDLFSIPDCVILGDRLRLEQVIGNIITNSYKYAGTSITVKCYFDDDFLVLDIGDTGGGVPEEELELITEKFKRGSNTHGKDGSGIGLYISDYFMKCMGGALSCRNEGRGLTVSIRIKLA